MMENMTNAERASYIRGLMDGLELDPKSKETKVLNAMAELLTDMCIAQEELEEDVVFLEDKFDELDHDLGEVEEEVYGMDGGCGCGHHHDEPYFEITCPSCGEVIELGDEIFEEDSLNCPACGETLEFDFGEDDLDEIESLDK